MRRLERGLGVDLHRRRLMTSVVAVGAASLPRLALGQGLSRWPSRQPIKVIVPFSAGSAVDVIARIVLASVSQQIGQTIVLENRLGAGGTIAIGSVAKADPDGYTMLATSSAHTITPSLYVNLPYDAMKDFAAIIPLASLPNVLLVKPARFASIRALVEAGRSKPGVLSYGSAGVGAIAHLNAERFRLAAGFEAVHVPYKGAPEVITDVIGGRIDFYFSPLSAALPLIQDGQVCALAVSSTARSSLLPEIPTTLEAGYPNSDYTFWAGLCAPAMTPREIVLRMHDETARSLAIPDVSERLQKLGADRMPLSPEGFDTFLRNEVITNAAIVKAAGIKPI